MRAYRLAIFIAAVMLLVSCAGKQPVADEKPATEIKNFRIVDLGDGEYGATVRASEPVGFRVLYSKSPYKIVVFAPDAKFSEEVLHYNFSDTVVEGIVFTPGKAMSQIEILLTENVDYDYSMDDNNTLGVTFRTALPDLKSDTLGSYGMDVENLAPEKVGLADAVKSFADKSNDGTLHLEIGLDGVARYDYGYLDDNTLFVDLFDVKSSLGKKAYPGNGVVSGIKVGEYYPPKKVRFLVDVFSRVPVFAGQNGSKLTITSDMAAAPEEERYIASIDTLNYKNIQSIVVKFVGRVSYTKKIVNNALHLEFESDVKMLGNVKNRFSFSNMPFSEIELVKIDGKPVLVLEPSADIFARVDTTPEGLLISASYEEFARAAMELAKAPEKKEGDSKQEVNKDNLITLNMKEMDIREAIRLIYYGRDMNLIFGEGVKGEVTLFLKDVDYETALKLILRDRNLTLVEEGNIAWVISSTRYQQRQAEIEARKRAEMEAKNLAPLQTEVVSVNFATAGELVGIIQSVLSNRGKVEVEARTNSFVITDTKEAIQEVKRLMKSVDKRTPQVTIEARIVEVTDINSLGLGIQWGASVNDTTKVHFPNQVDVGGDSSGYMVNIPAAGAVGTIGLSLLNRTGTFGLDLALSALETQNKAKTISSPRVTTLDNMEATIKSGSTALIVPSGDNAEAEEIDVGIKLTVRPQITSNKMVFLDIDVEKSSLGEVTANTATSDEKKAETKVLLANGETTVIGGLYQDEQSTIDTGVPGFKDIPVLGYLFKGKTKRVTRSELLVFITPYVDM
ncbi:type IV pilus secretin PilQ [Limisalsivibrio acetivorans]|uniref:type IV pilus secretin PilQ n=1 Tax=Limisalsivibrio acetivorans TaxID=1304888 RepID=UPI0003B77C56|nr:type IV pilus secretin PilQ [Limisalsivibrio acetivorans]